MSWVKMALGNLKKKSADLMGKVNLYTKAFNLPADWPDWRHETTFAPYQPVAGR